MIKLMYLIVLMFAVIGALSSGLILHEVKHQKDLAPYIVKEEGICFLEIPSEGNVFHRLFKMSGSYTFQYDPKDSEIVEEVMKRSELKGYAISFGLVLLLAVAVFSIMLKEVENETNINR